MRRLVPTVVAVLAFAAVSSGCLPQSDAPQNGRLPESALTTVTESCRTANDVADPLRHLLYTAWLDGVPLMPETTSHVEPLPGPPRIESCYRSFEMQQWWRDFYCFFLSCGYAAVPGTSVHGWGRAIDFEDGPQELTFSSAGYQWLKANAGRYGFVHPAWAEPDGSIPEPWHWEHP